MKVYVQRLPYELSATFHLVDRETECIAAPVVFEMVPIGDPGVRHAPTFTLDVRVAEQMFQEMWDQGFRPAGEIVSDKTLAAQDKHIAFAETIAKAALKIKP